MYAQLIICAEEPSPDLKTGSSELLRLEYVPTAEPIHWQLTANDLTPGKLIDLLVYLDRLGFNDAVTE